MSWRAFVIGKVFCIEALEISLKERTGIIDYRVVFSEPSSPFVEACRSKSKVRS